ncbi:hypothetical protein ABB37_02856 [Leptomonas pyrrhocoris]|uniref:Ama1 protein n=1 Tax=Leptomonas pyrrhocoris TaxID=157538 RepID=A0A0N0VGF1_LEPPY|nr:hypothetical protein ABB37_02856 [Leptomonas pyrrhocoris]KPA83161.1 hypothetical protein ABB37_02856 [Leptomonas pyrrhocoris]|eukprot:XP_015661600.1 hypothetical protein ABB37_02856 [Leptomonas pyrrhocoris]
MSKATNVDYKQVGQRDVHDAVDAAPTEVIHSVGNVQRPWHYGLCTLCSEMNSCLECFVCAPCQLSRQFNMLYNLKPELHIPVCLAVVLLDSMGVPAGFALQYVIRSDIRRRYGIEGNIVSDCCFSWLCAPCAIQQQFLEMTSVGSCPGMSMCGVIPLAPEEPLML